MITNGLMLMAIGMGSVFTFLVLLTVAIYMLTVLTRSHAEKEQQFLLDSERKKRDAANKKTKPSSDSDIVAAIAAALRLR
jgi:sodium pump decarboxylase gamma subunit